MPTPPEYLTFFGLREQPFAPTSDPAYFLATRAYRECLFRVWDCVDERLGLAVVLGAPGAGKTTLIRKISADLLRKRDQHIAAFIGSPLPSWTSQDLMDAIVRQFGITPESDEITANMEQLADHLVRNRERVCTLVIDDAQNLNKRGQLELLRLLQNLETQQQKLMNILLFAQSDWHEVLTLAPAFTQRVSVLYQIPPLTQEETGELIHFRLDQAGAEPEHAPDFDQEAIAVVHRIAQGMPRLTVTLCRNVLLLAAQLRTRSISAEMLLHTARRTMLLQREVSPEASEPPMPTAERLPQPNAVTAAIPVGPAAPEPSRPSSGVSGPAVAIDAASQERQSREQRAASILLRGGARRAGEE